MIPFALSEVKIRSTEMHYVFLKTLCEALGQLNNFDMQKEGQRIQSIAGI